MAVNVSPAVLDALGALFEETRNYGLDLYAKRLTEFAAEHDLQDLFPSDRPATTRRRATFLFTWSNRANYQAYRLQQLHEGSFPLWVYRKGGCCRDHDHLDGLVLPRSHSFWCTRFPANGCQCDCWVVGARTAASARRRGGDPEKRLPDGWNVIDAFTQMLPWVEEGFLGQIHPPTTAWLARLPFIASADA